MAEPIDITPVGVQKDPARVNRALDAFQQAQANAANALIDIVQDLHDRGLLRDEVRSVVLGIHGADVMIRACQDAQEEFLRAVAGAPSRGVRE